METVNLAVQNLDRISDYVENGGTRNFRNLFYYVRKELDGKKLFAPDYLLPKKYSAELYFHIDEEAVYESVKDFESYCLGKGFHKPGAKKVAIFTSVPGPFNANRDHLNSIIAELQSRGYNVYPVSSFSRRRQFLQKIQPSLVVYMPHGRFGIGSDAEAMERELVKLNVPVICPVNVMKRYDDWVTNPQGLSGGILCQLIAMPEFDGGILPYAVIAQYEDENGLLLFKAIPDRLKNFGDIVDIFIRLQTIARQGPILGLMGTLIPMGSALSGLGQGDVRNMQVAFATTVIGLFAGTIGFLLLHPRQRMLVRYLSDMELLVAHIAEHKDGSGEHQHVLERLLTEKID